MGINGDTEMRLLRQNIERDGSGTMTLLPEEAEDMVCTYIYLLPSSALLAITDSTTGNKTESMSNSLYAKAPATD